MGLLISRCFDLSSSQVKSLERKIAEEQLKQKRYRESVNEHFNVTADLIHHMTGLQWAQQRNSLGESYGGKNTLRQAVAQPPG